MSLPSSGEVTVEARGQTCSFNGAHWAGAPALAAELNQALERVPAHHYPLRTVAERCLAEAGIDGTIKSVVQDAWPAGEEIAGVD